MGQGFESLLAYQLSLGMLQQIPSVYVVGVVQLAEHRIVVPGVVGSSPITHPRKSRGSGLPRSPISFHIGASPSGKARDFDSLIRWFESSRPSHFTQYGYAVLNS